MFAGVFGFRIIIISNRKRTDFLRNVAKSVGAWGFYGSEAV
jgi:hypothetical protein